MCGGVKTKEKIYINNVWMKEKEIKVKNKKLKLVNATIIFS